MWFNPIMRCLLRSPLHFTVSKNTMLMTYTGRKSGKVYTVPMNYLDIEGVLYTINSRERTWWRNLRGGAEVTLRLKGEDRKAWAEAIEDQEEVAEKLSLYFKTAPQIARYMKVKTDVDGSPNAEDIHRGLEKLFRPVAGMQILVNVPPLGQLNVFYAKRLEQYPVGLVEVDELQQPCGAASTAAGHKACGAAVLERLWCRVLSRISVHMGL